MLSYFNVSFFFPWCARENVIFTLAIASLPSVTHFRACVDPPPRLTLTAAAAAIVVGVGRTVAARLKSAKGFKTGGKMSFDELSGVAGSRPTKSERKEASTNCLANAPIRSTKRSIKVRDSTLERKIAFGEARPRNPSATRQNAFESR